MALNVLVGIDRDGTLIYDDGSFPGSRWPNEEYSLMPGVVDGLHLLQDLNREAGIVLRCVMISNQSGPVRGKVTLENTVKVNEKINELLIREGVGLDAMYFCEHAPPSYAEECRQKGKHIDYNYIKLCPDWKPGTGMLEKAATQFFNKNLNTMIVYMIGDRATDVQTGLNANGKGFFVPSNVQDRSSVSEAEELQKKFTSKVYIASGDMPFLDAARKIIDEVEARIKHGL